MIFIRCFNQAWEEEREKIEIRLVATLEKEIISMESSAKIEEDQDKEYALEIKKKRAELILRKSLATYESEKIALQRMQIRISYVAIIISSLAFIFAVFK
jgi:hypothetical protein